VKLQTSWFTGSRRPSHAVTDPFPPRVPSPRPYVGQATTGPQHRRPAVPEPRPHPRALRPTAPQPTYTPHAPVDPEPPRPAARLVRAIIGDELRIPILWCEFGTCVAYYTHADALGERDLRGRAQSAGWCYDLLGRLACPACVQHDPTFWVARPPVPTRRY
jgi:hypothetical protein